MSKRVDEFESKLDKLLEEFNDVECEDLADSLEYYSDTFRAKANR